MHCVKLQQMGVHGGITDRIIDPCDLCARLKQGAQRKLADAAQSVQRVDSHISILFRSLCDVIHRLLQRRAF